jgi:ketosteroid isomerase-like protein
MAAGPFKGRAAIREWFEGLREAWNEPNKAVLTELYEVGDTVVARIDWQVRGRSSGIDTSLDATSLNSIERGKIVRQQWYFDQAKPSKPPGEGVGHVAGER